MEYYDKSDVVNKLNDMCVDGYFDDFDWVYDSDFVIELLEQTGLSYYGIMIQSKEKIVKILKDDYSEYEQADEPDADDEFGYTGLGLSDIEREQLYQAEIDDDVRLLNKLWRK